MADELKPILIFPEKSQADDRRSSRGGGGGSRRYSPERQKQRLQSRIDGLQRTIRRFEAGEPPDDDGDTILPDRVLVFETKDAVEDFWKAVEKIDGLSGLAEWLRPTRSAESEAERRKGRLYLTLPNLEGLNRLLRLWEQYQETGRVDRPYGPIKDVFSHLEDLRRWGVKDRITPEARAYFEEQLELISRGDVADGIGVEIELWPYASTQDWSDAFQEVERLITNTDGAEILNHCRIESAQIGVILAVLPAELLRQILAADNLAAIERDDLKALADANPVQSFGPRGQIADGAPADDRRGAGDLVSETTATWDPDTLPAPSLDRYDVAVMDTDQQGQHTWLARHIEITDPQGLTGISVEATRHGTAMASLVIHGDLSKPTPLNSKVASVPVMEGVEENGRGVARFRRTDIMADVLHIAIRHLFEVDGEDSSPLSDIKVVSLSVGDANRPFLGRMSAAARILDYLSYHYGLLILVSAGNYNYPLDLPVSEDEFSGLSPTQQRQVVLNRLREYAGDEDNPSPPTILAPAEAVNVLTVGAIDHDDEAAAEPPTSLQHRFRADAASHAPYSRIGPGREGQIKPEILFSGGAPLYNKREIDGQIRLSLLSATRFGTLQAQPHGPQDPPLTRAVGTSSATASAANAAGRIVEMLREIETPAPVAPDYIGVLTKALMVHGCQDTSWYVDAAQLHLGKQPNSLETHQDLARFVGHGIPDVDRVLACTNTRATVLGLGTLEPNSDAAKTFIFPIPGSLNGQTLLRRVTVTLAWFAPCDARRIAYRRARLELDLNVLSGRLTSDRVGPTRGNGRHLDSKGTVIHQVYEGEDVASISESATLPIKVQRAATSTLPAMEPLRFGLAVTLDTGVRVDQSLSIYEEVATRLGVRPRLRSGTTR